MQMLSKRARLAALMTFLPIGAGVLLWSQVGPAVSDPPMRLEVSLSDRTLKVIADGEVVHTYGVAVGRPQYPTPTGSFRTGDIIYNPSWTPPNTEWARDEIPRDGGDPENPLRGVKIYFRAPDYYIHGTSDPGSIGYAESHGCIRMTEDEAVELAHRIEEAGGSVPLEITE